MIEERIQKLKEEKNAVILAHYYVDGEVQALADYVGDSYFLAKLATTIDKENIILCGVWSANFCPFCLCVGHT